MTNNRIDFLDYSRAIALMAVLLLHASANYVRMWGNESLSLQNWMFANCYQSTVRWGVPVFLVVSGYLLANNLETFDPDYYFKRRIFKVFIPFMIWSAIYALWVANNRQFMSCNINWDRFIDLLKAIPRKRVYSHLGFFYYYIPLCMIAPLVSFAHSRMGSKLTLHLIYVWLFFCILNTLGAKGFIFSPLIMFVGYLFVGKYLIANDLFSLKTSISLFIISILGVALGTYLLTLNSGKYNGLLYGYSVIPTALCAISVVQFFKHKGYKVGWLISLISKYSLGIFFIHFMVLRFMEIHIVGMLDIPAAINIPLRFLFILVVSFVITATLAKFRYTRFIVP